MQSQNNDDKDTILYNTLPYFCKVFSDAQPVEFVDKFPDIHLFCARVSQLFVKEIKSRAANKSSEEGSLMVAQFLEPDENIGDCLEVTDSEHAVITNKGSCLLNALHLMSTGHTSLIECMAAASLPSTLVKCLYIFLDLPSKYSSGCIFQTKFRELLQRLCLYPVVAEELARKDALCHLFNALTDWCPPHNSSWRMTTTVVLSTIAQNSLTPIVIKSIHDSECVRHCLKSLSESKSNYKDLVNSFVSLLHIVRESSVDDQTLLDDFRTNNGYFVLIDFCLKIEESCTAESENSLQTLVGLVGNLAICGPVELRPKAGAGEQIHKIPGFRMHMPKTQARKSVRNMHAFDVLQSLFNSCSTAHLSLLILKTVQSIFLQDLSNYFILEQQNTLVIFAKKIFEKPYEVQEAYFNLLELLVNKLHYVFMKEISSIVVQMKLFNLSPSLVIAYRYFIRLLQISPVFKDVFHDVGLLELTVDLLNCFIETMFKLNNPSTVSSTSCSFTTLKEIGHCLLEFLQCTITSHAQNGDVLIRLGATSCLLNRILTTEVNEYILPWRSSALTIYEELMLSNGGEELMPYLLENMHHAYADLKIDILCSFCRILRESHRCRAVFRKLNGFVYVMQELIYLEGCLNLFPGNDNDNNNNLNSNYINDSIPMHTPLSSMNQSSHHSTGSSATPSPKHAIAASQSNSQYTEERQEEYRSHLSRKAFLSSLTYPQLFLLIKSIFSTLGIAMKFEPANAHYFVAEIQYTTLTDAIISLGSNKQSYTTNLISLNQSISISLNDLMIHRINDSPIHYTRSTRSKYLYALFMNLKLMESLLSFSSSSSSSSSLSPKLKGDHNTDGYPKLNKSSDVVIDLPRRVIEWCLIFRYLYDLAIDAYDRNSIRSILLDKNACCKLPRFNDNQIVNNTENYEHTTTATTEIVESPVNNTAQMSIADILIIHPDAIICLLKLIANLNEYINNEDYSSLSWCCEELIVDFQNCLLTIIADLLHSERNQQLMCNVSMPRELLTLFSEPLSNDNHPLHDQVRSLFECLAVQALTPNDLREFLRLSNTLSKLDNSLIHPSGNDTSSSLSFTLSDEAKILFSKSLSFRLNPLNLSQIKCLITISTPSHIEFNKQIIRRDSRINYYYHHQQHYSSSSSGHHQSNNSVINNDIDLSISPSFVEFNMSTEGFGCLFLPSIAPQGSSSISHLCGAVNSASLGNASINDMNAGGGVGIGERSFPPSYGFTYSAWVSVQQFDNVTNNSCDNDIMKQSSYQQQQQQQQQQPKPQAVHLLTLVRGVQSVNDQLVFLRIYIHPLNHYLVVSTQERLLQPGQSCDIDIDGSMMVNNANNMDQSASIDSDPNMKNAIAAGTCAVFPCGLSANSSNEWPLDVWRHVVVVFNRAGMIKTSSCSLYLDGHFIGSRRVTYIGASSASSALGRNIMSSSLCGFIGTPASMRRSSKLLWKIGPFHFIEEPLTANRVAIITKLGPNYMGSFQAVPSMPSFVRPDVDESHFPLFSEDKLVFGIYACNLSTLTLNRIRKVYNQCDAKAIARQFYLSLKENATPIRILRNSALHLNGPARPLGAVLVGYQGVRTFTPSPVCRLIHCVTGGEGMRIGLALIAMSQDVETLYASNKAACTLLKSNPAASIEMLRTQGYQIYAVLLRRKRHLLTTRILDSILSLALNMNSWADKSLTYQTFPSIDHPAFEDLVCDLDLWRIERQLTNESDIRVRRNALTGMSNNSVDQNQQSNIGSYACTDDTIQFIEDDYQLVANLISHLIELLPNPLPKATATAANTTGHGSSSTNNNNSSSINPMNSPIDGNDKSEVIIHPIWNVIFDRVVYLLMNSHSNWIQGKHIYHLVIDVIGRKSFMHSCLSFIQLCLSTYTSSKWILRFCQLIIWTLPNSPQTNEKLISLDQSSSADDNSAVDTVDREDILMLSTELLRNLIILRNHCLEVLIQLITETDGINDKFCNELLNAIGYDWFYLLLRPNIHSTTISYALHLLLLLILNSGNSSSLMLNSSSTLQQKNDRVIAFRLGCPAGRWLRGCEILLKKRHGLLIDNSKSSAKRKPPLRYTSALRDLKLSSCQQPGFIILQILLPYHMNLIETFLFLFALLLKIPVRSIPQNAKFDFDTFYSLISCENNCISPTLIKREVYSTSVDRSMHSTSSFITSAPTTSSFSSSTVQNTSVGGLVSGLFSGSSGNRRAGNTIVSMMMTSSSIPGNHKTINNNNNTNPNINLPNTSHSQTTSSNNLSTASTVIPYSNQVICPEAGTLILHLIRLFVYEPESLEHLKLSEFTYLMETKQINLQENINSAIVMLKFLIYLYQSKPTIRLAFITPGLLTNLIGLLVPFTSHTNDPSAPLNIPNFKDPLLLLPLPSSKDDCLENPLHQITLDFIKLIVSDSFALHPSFHQPTHIVDILLEAWSDQCSSRQHQHLQTLILCNLMDHFLATDILNDQSLCVGPNGSIQYIPANLIYFSARIVDKLWQGCFSKEVNRVVNFLIHLITYWPDQSSTATVITKLDNSNENTMHHNLLTSKFTIHSLYRSLNRTILYQLSRPILTRADQIETLTLLNCLNNTLISKNAVIGDSFDMEQLMSSPVPPASPIHHHNRHPQQHHDQIPLIFNAVNEDTEFPACLVHLLIQLIRLNETNKIGSCNITDTLNTTSLNKSTTLSRISSIASTNNIKYDMNMNNDNDSCNNTISATPTNNNNVDENTLNESSSVNYYYHTTFGFEELDDASVLPSSSMSTTKTPTGTTVRKVQTPTQSILQGGTATSTTAGMTTLDDSVIEELINNNNPKSMLSAHLSSRQHNEEDTEIYRSEVIQTMATASMTTTEGEFNSDYANDNYNYADEIVLAALKLWSKCYLAKKSVLAQLVPEAPLVSGLSVPSLTDWATILEGPCLIAWAQHVDCEAAGSGGISSSNMWGRIPGTPSFVLNMLKQEGSLHMPASQSAPVSTSAPSGLQHHISMKLSKVSGNVFKLGSTSGSTVQSSVTTGNEYTSASVLGVSSSIINSNAQINYLSPTNTSSLNVIQENAIEAIQLWAPNQMNFIRELLDQQKTQFYQNLSFNQRHLESEWEKIENELTRERGLWGRITPDLLAKWELDPTEGPLRMRKRMILNNSFYLRYPHLPNYLMRLLIRSPEANHYYPYTLTLTKSKKPRSRDSKLYFLNYKSKSLLHEDYGPLAPWIPFTKSMKLEDIEKSLQEEKEVEVEEEEAENDEATATVSGGGIDTTDHTDETCFYGPKLRGSAVDQQGKSVDNEALQECKNTVLGDSEFTVLSRPLVPEDIELSKTASLIRSTRNSVCVERNNNQHKKENDVIDELIPANSRSVSEEPEELIPYDDVVVVTGDGGGMHDDADVDTGDVDGDLDPVKQSLDHPDISPPYTTTTTNNNNQTGNNSNKQTHMNKDNAINTNIPNNSSNPIQSAVKELPNPVNNFISMTEDKLAGHEAILRLLEPGERLHVMYRCARILGLDIYEGLLLFGRTHFYVIDGYTLINTREIVAIDSLPSHIIHEPIVPSTIIGASNNNSNNNSITRSSFHRINMSSSDLWSSGAVSQIAGKQYFKFPYENIQGVQKRRYLLHPIALEVFNSDGRNFLLAFSKGLQNKVYDCFQNVASVNSEFSQQKSSQSFLSSLLGVKSVMQRWEHGELSNFEYLMYLNTQAGRSYNDLIQYPVFPWVLADYDSEELDLSRPETFRDLSKPMGAQTPDRLAQFQRRYKEWDDPTGETPPYHYGTHYSSAMIVASYLFRMEPFAQHFLKLQGGHFDLPDRMFHSVKDAWLSASRHNMADVRELIPEFFYLPDFLINSNNFEMGIKQNGVEVNNVVLPPWAKSDPREFIRVHREALESEYVSAHLHEWIDLIFGYKQQGENAVQSANVFHYLFYEGNVDIYSIDDPLKRSAVIGFINNFGQIPKQLFKKPHPCRRVIIPRQSSRFFSSVIGLNSGSQLACDLFYRNLDILRPSLQPIKELKHAVGQIVQLDPQFIPSGTNINNMNTGATVNRPILSLNINSDNMNNENVNLSSANNNSSINNNNTNNNSNPGLISDKNVNSSGNTTIYQTMTTTIIGGPIIAVEQNKCLLPPNYTHYLAWGFTDGSLRLGSLFDSNERVRYIFEMVDQNEILCCTSPNKYTIITAGLSTVIRVWFLSSHDVSNNTTSSNNSSGVGLLNTSSSSSTAYGGCHLSGGSRLKLRATLYGHTDAITCLAASDAFNLIVSGSRDRTCILWDLSRLCFLRQLSNHIAPIAAICINEATGDIASCAGTRLYLWNCNGEPVASTDTPVGRNKQILCVCMSTLYDWDAENVVITGSSDGVVRMWCLKHICTKDNDGNDDNGSGSVGLRGTVAGVNNTNNNNNNADNHESNNNSDESRTDYKEDYCENSSEETRTVEISTVSSYDTSEIDSTLGSSDKSSKNINIKDPNNNKKWTRALIFRSKLTMHTAYERSDNKTPADITALAISRDHRSVLVGDAIGRVFVWSVPSDNSRGGMTDQWIKDEGATNCAADGCGTRFSLTERKHHCRNCGKVFCSKCSRFESEIYRLRLFKPVRVCQTCYNVLKLIQAPQNRETTAPL
uniref:Uncharacterized protein n=1 Tax=Trichobilharzia regenti TaxID=157069 RepID=A0AA85JEF8_TRIRE|nr:unnamed protein product [Trichobilharzia regenti]